MAADLNSNLYQTASFTNSCWKPEPRACSFRLPSHLAPDVGHFIAFKDSFKTVLFSLDCALSNFRFFLGCRPTDTMELFSDFPSLVWTSSVDGDGRSKVIADAKFRGQVKPSGMESVEFCQSAAADIPLRACRAIVIVSIVKIRARSI